MANMMNGTLLISRLRRGRRIHRITRPRMIRASRDDKIVALKMDGQTVLRVNPRQHRRVVKALLRPIQMRAVWLKTV